MVPAFFALALTFAGTLPAHAALRGRPMKRASESLQRQAPPQVSPRILEETTPANARVVISLSKQRAYLMSNGRVAIDSPVSTGKSAGMTPTGVFKITEKDRDHRSNIYGNFVDQQGRIVRGGVSVRIDSAPSGTRFVGAPMKYFMRIHGAVGMHVGILPGYPASHGCIRMPEKVAEMIFQRVKLGTPVEVVR
ncbi:MAG TPA: L,D-transpeptidase family protein [Chthoniobacteraceae bacterium]|nr:L,D-transpeptidase family protein [Chthoniobacteraceae bacterium]